ncbi:hypothetical protein [Streptomyces sp. NPDC002573]|uniref:hypothetical protein n=1 Tax=Streptomyces sp. NPDC002573 TaxID=3364651 RepID=UPI00369CAB3B
MTVGARDRFRQRTVILTDDYGQRVRMSADQLSSLVADAKADKLDGVARTPD